MDKIWDKIHDSYVSQEKINSKTAFSEFAISYFPASGKVLDLGSGQGQDSIFFSEKGHEVTAVDFSNLVLDFLRKKTIEDGLNIKLMNVDVSQILPFEDNSLDVVYSHLSLHYFSHQETRDIFGEIFRVLKPEGVVAVLLNTVDDPESRAKGLVVLEENYYQNSKGMKKRYFSVDYLREITKDLFVPLVLDNKGETYTDEVKTYIRFVGKKKV